MKDYYSAAESIIRAFSPEVSSVEFPKYHISKPLSLKDEQRFKVIENEVFCVEYSVFKRMRPLIVGIAQGGIAEHAPGQYNRSDSITMVEMDGLVKLLGCITNEFLKQTGELPRSRLRRWEEDCYKFDPTNLNLGDGSWAEACK